MIELKNVSYSYGDEAVLKNISITFKDGEFCAVLGHNGSGKSTLAKLLNGILVPKSGKVTVYGLSTADENNLMNIRKNVGMVFQNPDNQIVSAIVEDDVAFGAENLCVPPQEIRKRVDKALDAVNMTRYGKAQTAMLSGGQKQRVAIAGVLAMQPKTIVFDESTAMLDPKGRADFMNIVKELNTNYGMNIILVTHFMEEAAEADRVIVLEDGEIIMDDTPKKVFENSERLVNTGLGIPQMTMLAHELNALGIDMPVNVVSVEETAKILLTRKMEYDRA